jgi:hypothetical protein
MANTEQMLKEIEAVVTKHGATMAIDHIDAQKLSIKIAVAREGDAGLSQEGKQERERIALSKLPESDKALLDDPILLSIARRDNKSPAEVLLWLRQGEDDLAVKKFQRDYRAGRIPLNQ